ncbi:hypothetical protein Taro_000719 [Colocasia esculenta]|uniref:Uncharacterized protein n=1 Tax=Colocasia esculenta TaxID=4460 RepID=A0A843T8V8_COLES|nr:hypothetical protein [Colocasia esculenta]
MSEVITHIGVPTGLRLTPNSTTTATTTTPNLKAPSLLRDIRHIRFLIVIFISLPSRDDPLLHLPVRLLSLRLSTNTLQVFNHEPLHFSRHGFTTLDILVPCKPPTCKVLLEAGDAPSLARMAAVVALRVGSGELGRSEADPVDSLADGGSRRITLTGRRRFAPMRANRADSLRRAKPCSRHLYHLSASLRLC